MSSLAEKTLEEKCSEYEIKIRELENKIKDLESDKEYYNFLYQEEEEEDDEEEETDGTETDCETVPSDIDKELESDLEKEDRLVTIAVEINRLQFETSEHFHQIKKDGTANNGNRNFFWR